MKMKHTRPPLARLIQKTLIAGLIAAITVILGMFGQELLGAWTKPAPGLVVIAGFAVLAATR